MQPPVNVEIENSQLILEWFGFWPSFHDAEVISIGLHRSLQGKEKGPFLTTAFYFSQMTSELDEKTFYKLIKHCVIELEFENIESVELEGFNHQNALDGIEFSEAKSFLGKPAISVVFNSAYGVGFDLICSKVRVASLTPGKPVDHLHA